jgi:hypothetical protein
MAKTWTTPTAIHSYSGQYASYPAINTIDDNTATFWVASSTPWIIFDMGATKKITKIRIYQNDQVTSRFGWTSGLKVYISNDPANMGDVVWEGVLNANDWQETGLFSEKQGRYVKLLSKYSGAQGFSEFDAYAEAAGVAHSKVIAEKVGFVDGHSKVQHHKKVIAEVVGFVDEHDKDKCKKCKPSSVIVTF